jgi:large subunit ribosomal protein L40e
MAIEHIVFHNYLNSYKLAKYSKNITTKHIYEIYNKNIHKEHKYFSILINNTDIDKFKNIEEIKNNYNSKNGILQLKVVEKYNYDLEESFMVAQEKIYENISYQIYVKGLDGITHVIEFSPFLTGYDLGIIIEKNTGIPFYKQRLIFKGKTINTFDKNNNLEIYDIKKESTMHIVCRLRGGMFMETTSGNTDYENNDLSGVLCDLDLDENFE